MIEIADSDLRPLKDFSLKWRWTDERWNLLPPKSIQQIIPLAPAKCKEIWAIQKQYLSADGLNIDFFEITETIRTDTAEVSDVRKWLTNRIGDAAQTIVILWNEDTAVKSTSEIFCDYWNDFCYPVSDDVSISPLNSSWLLFYQHHDYLCFGKLKQEFIR